MKTRAIDNIKLGLFVIAALAFLILSLYLIGTNRNLFGSTFTISARFYNVNGLTSGNNVRFAGIDVGTVKDLTIESDSSVNVVMIIDKSVRQFIKNNSIATVGTDGLMGNKLININSVPGDAPSIQQGDVLASLKPIETDDMLRTLNATNENIRIITEDLKKITGKINDSNSLWSLLSDTTISKDLKEAVFSIKDAGDNASAAGREIADMVDTFAKGEGLAGTLFMDTVLSSNLRQSLNDVNSATNGLDSLIENLQDIVTGVNKGKGPAGAILTDSLMLEKINNSLSNIEQGTARFNENMEAMKHNFLFRRYFKKQEKEAKKDN